ncbi:MAG: hypothetical protein A2Z81_09430 [Omnitrophica WOR_2 bacterium GWA2_45_18]|nr:MAG: hypothetical protein A2Z81_09430 [Omnitrophica WOR_2 bacterium GWA2_45_18]
MMQDFFRRILSDEFFSSVITPPATSFVEEAGEAVEAEAVEAEVVVVVVVVVVHRHRRHQMEAEVVVVVEAEVVVGHYTHNLHTRHLYTSRWLRLLQVYSVNQFVQEFLSCFQTRQFYFSDPVLLLDSKQVARIGSPRSRGWCRYNRHRSYRCFDRED